MPRVRHFLFLYCLRVLFRRLVTHSTPGKPARNKASVDGSGTPFGGSPGTIFGEA